MRGGGRGAEKGRGGKSGGDGVVPSDHYGIVVEFKVA